MPDASLLLNHSKAFFSDILRAYWILIRVMVPALIVVKVLELAGGIALLSTILSPFMSVVGLESELGLVWATAILTNIYTAMAVFYQIASDLQLSVAQISILGSMILIAHAIPVEGAVAKAMGIPWYMTILLRIGGAYLFGLVFFFIYSTTDTGQELAQLNWKPSISSTSISCWVWDQLILLVSVFFILAFLMAMMRGLRYIGVEKLLHMTLNPLMRMLTVKKEAADITIIGFLLGLSFGAGLLIDESSKGHISKRDMAIVVCFLSLCHSVIEDTLLILLLGADLNVILWGRLAFSCIVVAILARTLFAQKTTLSPNQ